MSDVPTIELLYFEGCPSWEVTQELLETVLNEQNLQAGVQLVRVETDDEAKQQRFVGSPSIRINGEDLFPVDHEDYALGCRVYQTPDGMRGVPTATMIADALAAKIDN